MSRDENDQLHSAVLMELISEKRSHRKQRRGATRQLQADHRAKDGDSARAKYGAEQAERKDTHCLTARAI